MTVVEAVREITYQRELIYHLPAGPANADHTWRPILCGGGICYPTSTRHVDPDQICAACQKASQP